MPTTPDTPTPPSPAPADGAVANGGVWKPVLVFAFVVAALGMIYLSPLGEYLKHVQDYSERLRGMGAVGMLAFCGGVFVLTAIGVPRLALCALAGAVYGFWQGLLLAQLPTLAGYYVTFLFVRWGGRDFVLRRWPKLGHMHAMFDTHPTWKIFLIRQTPVTGVILNCFLAISRIRHRDFLFGSFLGLFPQAIPVTLLGSSAGHANKTHQYLILGATLLLFAGYVLFRRFARRKGELSEDS